MGKPVTPLLTVDAVMVSYAEDNTPHVVLIKRKNPPYGWALPGGFVDIGETVEKAVVREAKEETNMEFLIEGLVGIYSKPDRDPRGHTVSIVFYGGFKGDMKAKDDAIDIGLFDMYKLPEYMAFDHREIIKDYCFIDFKE